MKKIGLFLLCVLLLAPGTLLFGEDTDQEKEIRIAFPIFEEYILSKEERVNRKTTPIVLMVTGGAAVVAGITLFAIPDPPLRWEEQNHRYIASGAITGSGLVTAGIGVGLYFRKPKDFHVEYASVFNEKDPKLQEAYAAATLKDLADSGRKNRISSSVTAVAIPVVSTGASIIFNTARGDPWYSDLYYVSVPQVYNFINGIMGFFKQSEEERLYALYIETKTAMEE